MDAERQKRLGLIGKYRGASSWLLFFPVIYIPLIVYIAAVSGVWWPLVLIPVMLVPLAVVRAERALPTNEEIQQTPAGREYLRPNPRVAGAVALACLAAGLWAATAGRAAAAIGLSLVGVAALTRLLLDR